MFELYRCVRNEHDHWLVLLAAFICIAAAMTVVAMLRRARDAEGGERHRWLVAAGFSSGFGIWATHFTAMMGYDPGYTLGYQAAPTLLSLATAILSTMLGFSLALRKSALKQRLVAAAVFGIGVVCMHYMGMLAVEFNVHLIWSRTFVLASMLFAVLPIVPALYLIVDGRTTRSAIAGAVLIVTAILLTHFTGMAGMSVVPQQVDASATAILSSTQLGVTVASLAFSIMTLCLVTAWMSQRTRAVIDASEREFKALVEGISDCAIYMLSQDGKVVTWNAGAARLKGYSRDEAIGLDVACFYSAEEREAGVPAKAIEMARREGKFNVEGWRHRKDGTRFWAHVTVEAIFDEQGGLQGFAKITRDMTRMKEHQESLEAMSRKLNAALSNMHQGLCMFDADERLILANARAASTFDFATEEDLLGLSFDEWVRRGVQRSTAQEPSDDAVDEALERHRACIAEPDGGMLIAMMADGCTLAIAHSPMPGGGWVTTLDDITERREAEQRIAHMALHDALTGLPNRISYTERLDQELTRAMRNNAQVAVIGIDLDRFKEINDLHGHAMGDAVLTSLATRMSHSLESSELVARFGGDEFAALKFYTEESELSEFVARLEKALAEPLEFDDATIFPGASLGVAIYPMDGETREQIVNNADLAMYRAKERVGRQVCYYEQGMDELARTRRIIANDLRDAINRNELSLAFQVQKDVRTEAVVGYEALLRWHHPRNGWISPADFIPIAEESGEIVRIGEWVLRTACMEAARWPEQCRVAINLSPIQLMQADLLDIVESSLENSGLPASRLELEITETAFISDKPRALHVLRQIKNLGVSIAIDDFGTGYSSLDTLNSFPFDKIKIDRSFLMESDTSHQARAIIKAVLALGRSLKVPVLAEGLESEDQLRLLRSEGCNEAQGFLWGKPSQSLTFEAKQAAGPVAA